MAANNKVKYGLKNVYYAKATIAADGSATYTTPVAWRGAVSLSLDAEGETVRFRADNMDYWTGASNNGYTGDFESALIPDSFKTDILGEVADSNGVFIEAADITGSPFALLFQFEGDSNAIRHVLYNCTASRPSVAGQTTEDTIEPQTETLTITASQIYVAAISHNVVKGRCTADNTATYNAWFESVYVPTSLT